MRAPLSLVVVAVVAGTVVGAAGQAGTPKPAPAAKAVPARPSPGAGPVLVVDTVKGTFEFETYPADAPKTVEHVVTLAKRNYYNGQRVHRVESGFVVQFGDAQTRDYTKRDWWGRGGSGTPVGVNEIAASKRRLHVRGAVAMAHPGNPALADAQIYVALQALPRLNGKHVVFGHVIAGMDVVASLRVEDVIRRVTVKP